MNDEKIKQLTNDHWEWLKGLLTNLGQDWCDALDVGEPKLSGMNTLEYCYKTAMAHGYKHGWVDAKEDHQ